MSAGPHLLHRLRRWYSAHMLRLRHQQINALIAEIEASIRADHDDLAKLLFESRRIGAQLVALEQARIWRPPTNATRLH